MAGDGGRCIACPIESIPATVIGQAFHRAHILHNGDPPCAIIVDLLDVPKVDVTEEDAVRGARGGACSIVKGQGNDVLHVLRVLEGLHRRIEVALVRQVDALEDGAL
jgi:hypothetical protein